MSLELIGVIGFIALFALLAVGMPVGFSLIVVAFAGFAVIVSFEGARGMLSTAPYSIVHNYTWCCICLFVLMGHFAFHSGLITDVYTTAYKWLGRLRGGLSIATIAGCTGFAACTGSSAASVAFITTSALPEMERHNYAPGLATGCIAAGCTLGILIPPSIPFIVYGLFAEVSIGRLFIAGIIPGILLSGLFLLVIYIWVSFKPSTGPPGPQSTWRERFGSLTGLWSAIVLVVLVLGGLWGGVFTPVEAGGVGAFGAFLIGLVRRRFTRHSIVESLLDSVRISGMIFIIMIGAIMFNAFLAVSGLASMLASFACGLPVSPVVVVIFIMFFYLIGGCLMDAFGLIMLTLPIFIPIMNALGIDLILFGVLTTIMIEMAEITPPIGLNVFILSGMARHIPMYTVFRGIVPFLLAMIVGLALIIAFPQIALFLPGTMMK